MLEDTPDIWLTDLYLSEQYQDKKSNAERKIKELAREFEFNFAGAGFAKSIEPIIEQTMDIGYIREKNKVPTLKEQRKKVRRLERELEEKNSILRWIYAAWIVPISSALGFTLAGIFADPAALIMHSLTFMLFGLVGYFTFKARCDRRESHYQLEDARDELAEETVAGFNG